MLRKITSMPRFVNQLEKNNFILKLCVFNKFSIEDYKKKVFSKVFKYQKPTFIIVEINK